MLASQQVPRLCSMKQQSSTEVTVQGSGRLHLWFCTVATRHVLYYLLVHFGKLFQIVLKEGDLLLLCSAAASVIRVNLSTLRGGGDKTDEGKIKVPKLPPHKHGHSKDSLMKACPKTHTLRKHHTQ